MSVPPNATLLADPRLLALLERIAAQQATQHEQLMQILAELRYTVSMLRHSLPHR